MKNLLVLMLGILAGVLGGECRAHDLKCRSSGGHELYAILADNFRSGTATLRNPDSTYEFSDLRLRQIHGTEYMDVKTDTFCVLKGGEGKYECKSQQFLDLTRETKKIENGKNLPEYRIISTARYRALNEKGTADQTVNFSNCTL